MLRKVWREEKTAGWGWGRTLPGGSAASESGSHKPCCPDLALFWGGSLSPQLQQAGQCLLSPSADSSPPDGQYLPHPRHLYVERAPDSQQLGPFCLGLPAAVGCHRALTADIHSPISASKKDKDLLSLVMEMPATSCFKKRSVLVPQSWLSSDVLLRRRWLLKKRDPHCLT